MGKRASISVFLLILSILFCSIFAAKATVNAEQILLNDNFTSDNALDTNIWQANGPAGTATFAGFKGSVDAGFGGSYFSLVEPSPSFSSEGMCINSINGPFKMTTLESVNSFSAPLTLQASVTATQGGGGVFCMWIVNSATSWTGFDAILNTGATYYGLWGDHTNNWLDKLIYSSPKLNTVYQLTIVLNSVGDINLTVTANGQMLGSVTEPSTGSGPFKVVLAQYNIYTGTGTGSNQAYWKSIALTSSSPAVTPSPVRSPSPELTSTILPSASDLNTPRTSPTDYPTASPTSATNPTIAPSLTPGLTPSSSTTPTFTSSDNLQTLSPSTNPTENVQVSATPLQTSNPGPSNSTPFISAFENPFASSYLIVLAAAAAASAALAGGFIFYRSKKRKLSERTSYEQGDSMSEKVAAEPLLQNRWFLPSLLIAGISAGISDGVMVTFTTDIAKTFFGNSGPAAIGAVSQLGTLNSVGVFVFAFISSFLVVKFRHKQLFLAGLVILIISSIGSFAAPTIGWLQIFYALEGLGSIIISINAATLIGDSFPANKKAKAISYLLAIGAATVLIMIPITGFIANVAGWRFCFTFLVLPIAFAALIASSYALPSKTHEEKQVRKENPYKESFKLILKNKSALACLIASLLTVAGGQVAVFAMAFYRTRFAAPRDLTLGIYEVAIGLAFVGYLFSGQLINKVGAKRLALLSTAVNCCLTATFFFVPDLWFAFALDMTHVWFASMATPSFAYLGLEQVPQYRGTMVSLSSLFNTIGNVIAPALGGFLLIYAIDLGYGAVGIALASMTLAACVVALVWVKDRGYIQHKSISQDS